MHLGSRAARRVALVVAATCLVAPATAAAAPRAPKAPTIAGAWQVAVTFTENAPPSIPDGTETSFQGYGAGGLMLEWATGAATTAFGTWEATDRQGGFRYTFREPLWVQGAYAGYVVVQQTGRVSADNQTATSSGTGQAYSPTGTPLGPPSKTSSRGTRITFS
jgi:hypothetical protein